MACNNKTHVLRTSILGSNVNRTWLKLSDGLQETDTDVISELEASLKDCTSCKDKECRESQEWTYAIDNTGTLFSEDNTIKIELSDGTEFTFNQPPTTNWTPQMELWGQEIQATADAQGLKWFVETRFRDPRNPSSLAGGGGFNGPPSVAVSNALTNMLWRYVNIQICPGQPTPVAATIVNSSNPARIGKSLTTDGPVKGPLQRFFVCVECEELDVWYLEDGITLAEQGQIPNCYEPCGVIAQLPAPPENNCTFEIDVACDNNNSANTADFTNTITRRAKVCNGEQIAVDYFQADPDDANALISYELVGEFVDCATGEPIALPPVVCEASNYAGKIWRLKGGENPEANIEWWGGSNFTSGNATSAPHDNVSNIFSVSSDGRTLEHVNGVPSASFTQEEPSVNTSRQPFLSNVGASSNAETNGNDQLRVYGYINAVQDILLKDTNTNTGERGAIWINRCCAGSLELLFEDTTDSVSGDTSIFDGVLIPAGIHYIEIATSDLSAWQGFELSASFDDGKTYQQLPMYSTKPVYECIALARCVDTGLLTNRNTGEVITILENDLNCPPPLCDKCGCFSEVNTNSNNNPTAEEIANAIVRKQRDVTPLVYNFVNTNNNERLTDADGNLFEAGTMGTIKSIEDIGTGLVRWTIDGSQPANGNGFITTGPYHSNYDLNNVDLSLVRLDGSSANSDYTVMVEVYN
jgi:hypothetical protein